ncbi:MAG TPA: DUF1361 domain-containing protein [Proteiniclasticum sp.]|nr:DUF1361 domain-containing protein [Proteiniclasticum sp.]
MERYRRITLFIFIYAVISMMLFLKSGSFLFIMLVWNIILASLPLVFMNQGLRSGKKWKKIVYLLLWFAFFPNAIYMITDFIHLTNDQMIWTIPVELYSGLDGTRYSMEIFQWSKLLVISLGAFYALLTGLESLSKFYDFIKIQKGHLISGIAIVLVSTIASFGVFIGRFLRFNSWDIARPVSLMKGILDSLNEFTWVFTVIYATFILITFILFRWFKTGISE